MRHSRQTRVYLWGSYDSRSRAGAGAALVVAWLVVGMVFFCMVGAGRETGSGLGEGRAASVEGRDVRSATGASLVGEGSAASVGGRGREGAICCCGCSKESMTKIFSSVTLMSLPWRGALSRRHISTVLSVAKRPFCAIFADLST